LLDSHQNISREDLSQIRRPTNNETSKNASEHGSNKAWIESGLCTCCGVWPSVVSSSLSRERASLGGGRTYDDVTARVDAGGSERQDGGGEDQNRHFSEPC
jgi:hypothetical protein